MLSKLVAPGGNQIVSAAANAAVAIFSRGTIKLYKLIGYPNQPTQKVFVGSATDGRYTSSALTVATTYMVEADAQGGLYEVGTDAVVKAIRTSGFQSDPVALNATGALTAAGILSGIVTSTTAAAVAGTIPTGAVMDLSSSFSIGDFIDWSVINTGGNTFTVTAATGHTIVGVAAVVTVTSARFRTRKTAADTFITYRLS